MHDTEQPDQARSYHHGDLRKTLLAACCRCIAEEGTEGLSLRALARQAGVSATAPYRHFDSRQSLLAALAAEGFEELADAMQPLVDGGDPVTALFEAGCRYVQYARSNPVKYHLMFGDAIGDFSEYGELFEAAQRCYGRLERILAAGIESGQLRSDDLAELGGTVWASVHGLAGLVIAADRKADGLPPELIEATAPLHAQQQVAAAPERALLRLMEGVVRDRQALAALQRNWGLD